MDSTEIAKDSVDYMDRRIDFVRWLNKQSAEFQEVICLYLKEKMTHEQIRKKSGLNEDFIENAIIRLHHNYIITK